MTTQHSLDLLPAALRARGEAGVRTGRFIAAAMFAVVLMITMATHSMFRLTSSQEELFATSIQAEQVFAAEARSAELKSALKKTHAFIKQYERIALPLNVSGILATVVNQLPRSVTIDQIDINAGGRATNRGPRAKGTEVKDDAAPRVLTAEISGFAANDQDIAELVDRLDGVAAFREVNLDFSRTRKVNDRDAREFRLSFKVDLDGSYNVEYRDDETAPSLQEIAHGE